MQYLEWEYSGDINPQFGGIWTRPVLEGDGMPLYVDMVIVEDLDSGCGADGLNLIGRVDMLCDEITRDRVRRALDCWGMTPADLRGRGKDTILRILAEAFYSYGYARLDDPNAWYIVITDWGPGSDKRTWQGWREDIDRSETVRLHKIYNGDLKAYVESELLD